MRSREHTLHYEQISFLIYSTGPDRCRIITTSASHFSFSSTGVCTASKCPCPQSWFPSVLVTVLPVAGPLATVLPVAGPLATALGTGRLFGVLHLDPAVDLAALAVAPALLGCSGFHSSQKVFGSTTLARTTSTREKQAARAQSPRSSMFYRGPV